MDARSVLSKDLGVEFQTLKVGSSDKAYVQTVEDRPWRQHASAHAARHLVNADIVPESALWNANYPAFFARNRLNTLQLFLHPAAKQSLDTLVCIAGNDGDNNVGSQQLLAYVLQGKGANELGAKDSDATTAAAAKEEVLIVNADSASLWTTAKHPYFADQSQHVTALAANWNNGELWQHVLSEETRDDYETAKINFFVNYFRSPDARSGVKDFADKANCSVVGVPFCPEDKALSIEKWPLVQAFALGDGIGAGTFFTLQHNVQSCAHVVQELERNVDAQTLRVAALSHVARLDKHWSDSLQMLNGIRSAANRAQLCEADVAEALTTFFEFGKMGHGSSQDDSGLLFQGARVLFGARSVNAGIKSVKGASSDSATIADAAGHGTSHFTVEGQDALSGIRAARSYFLSSGAGAGPEGATTRLMALRVYEELVECHTSSLEQLGGLVSQHVRNLINNRPGALSLERLESALAKHVASELTSRIAIESDVPAPEVEAFKAAIAAAGADNWVAVHVHGFDATGAPASGPGSNRFLGDVHRRNFYLEIKVSLGSNGALVIGDTVPALVLRGEGIASDWPAAPLVLTASIPYFGAWQGSGAEEEAQNTAVAASLEDPAFISNDIVRFDWAAAAAAHPMCTGIGIGAPTDEIVRDCLVLLNNPDEEEEDEGDAAGDDGSLAVPHQCHLYGDLHLHESGFVLRVPGVAPIPVSFFEAAEGEGGDVARAAVVDACPRELSLLHIDFTERARDILFNEDRFFFGRRTTSIAVALPIGSDAKRRLVAHLGRFCKDPSGVNLAPYAYALDQLELFRLAALPAYLQAAAEQDRLLLNRKLYSLGGGAADVSGGGGGGGGESSGLLETGADDDEDQFAPGSEPENVILVTGAAHSGKQALAQALARELHRTGVNRSSDGIFDASSPDSAPDGQLDAFDLAALSSWLRERRQERADSAQRQAAGAVVIVAPDFVAAPTAVAQLRRLRTDAKYPGNGVLLRASIHAVNVESYTVTATQEEDASSSQAALGALPGVFQSVVPGFVSAVVLTHSAQSASPSDAMIYLRQLVEALSAGGDTIDVVRASGGISEDLRLHSGICDLLPPDLQGGNAASTGSGAVANFQSRHNRRLRRLLAVAPAAQKSNRDQTFVGSVYNRLGRAQLSFAHGSQAASAAAEDGEASAAAGAGAGAGAGVKFSVRALRNFFTKNVFPRGAAASRKIGDVFSVSGRAVLLSSAAGNSKPDDEVVVRFWAAPPHFFASEEAGASSGAAWESSASGDALVWSRVELNVTGASLNEEALQQAFVAHVWDGGETQKLRGRLSVATLTPEQKEEIKQRHISDPLPQGFYFDGANYINADRRIQKYHPDMDKFMEEYVREQLDIASRTNDGASSKSGGGAAVLEDDVVIEEDLN